MDDVDEAADARHQRWLWRAGTAMALLTLVVTAAVVVQRPWESTFAVGESRPVVLEVDECGAMEVEGGTWSSGGTAGSELANAFAQGPEPGTLTRLADDEALFTSDLTGHTLTMRRPEFVNLGCVGAPEEPGGSGPVAGHGLTDP